MAPSRLGNRALMLAVALIALNFGVMRALPELLRDGGSLILAEFGWGIIQFAAYRMWKGRGRARGYWPFWRAGPSRWARSWRRLACRGHPQPPSGPSTAARPSL